MSPAGRLTSPSLIAVLGRDLFVRLLQISRSGCLLETAHALPIGAIAVLSVQIEGRQYTDDIRVLRAQRVAGAGERHEIGVEFLWLQLPGEASLRSYAATLTDSSAQPANGNGQLRRQQDSQESPPRPGGFTSCSVAQRTDATADCAMGGGLDTGHSPNIGEDRARRAHSQPADRNRTPEPAGGTLRSQPVSGEEP
jgi:hypothetical protein